MKNKNKKGVFSIVFIFVVLSLILIFTFAIIVPIGTLFTTESYKAGEQIMLKANDSISKINNTEIKEHISEVLTGATDNTQENIEVLSGMYKYSWIIILAIITLVLFLLTRSLVEYQSKYGGII